MRFDFKPQTSNKGVGIRGLSVVDERIAWASGANGSIARTVDGGQSWNWSIVPGFTDLHFVCAPCRAHIEEAALRPDSDSFY